MRLSYGEGQGASYADGLQVPIAIIEWHPSAGLYCIVHLCESFHRRGRRNSTSMMRWMKIETSCITQCYICMMNLLMLIIRFPAPLKLTAPLPVSSTLSISPAILCLEASWQPSTHLKFVTMQLRDEQHWRCLWALLQKLHR